MIKFNPPSYQLQKVPLSRIDTGDDTYRITTRSNIEDLLISIRHDGLLNPPLVFPRTTNFTVVGGFRRIAACRKLGLAKIMVHVLGSNLSALECLRIAIADNAFQRPLDLLETSRALYKLATHSHPGSHLNELAASLGLPSNPSIIKKVKDLCLLPEEIQAGILDDTISLSMAGDLKVLPPDCAAAFGKLFGEFKLSLNKQREIVTWVKEIARREGIAEQTVLESRHLRAIIDDRDRDRGQRAREIRSYLRQRRYPQIVKAEAKFENQRRRLNLGSNINLIPPKNFEATNYTLNLSFNSIAQLKTLHTKIHQLIQLPEFKQIVEGKDNPSR